MIDLRVDDQRVEIEDGASVLDAARKVGICVPTLCDQPDLRPFGGCRLCIVEIEGNRGFQTSCTTPARSGMVVWTNTPRIQTLRKNLLELLLSEHPIACLVCADQEACWVHHECTRRAEITTGCNFCPKGDMCDLRHVAQHVFGEGGVEVSLPLLYKELPIDRRDPFIDRDDNLCILCGRCVRACERYGLTYTLDFVQRGSQTRVGTAFNRTLVEANCRFCGSCVDACPTGSLSERVRRWDGAADSFVHTTCSFCSVGCQFDLGVKNGRVIESLPRRDGPVNLGDNCVRGRFAVVEFNRSLERLRSPLVRRNGELVEVPWDTALATAADGIRRARPEKSALFYSGSCTNESIYYAHKFARDALGTGNVDSALRLSYGPLLATNGNGTLPAIGDITEAAAVLIIDADPDFSHPVVAQKIKHAVKEGDTKLVIVAPGATGLSKYACREIRHGPGNEASVLEALYDRLAGRRSTAVVEDVEAAACILEEAASLGPVIVLFGSGVMRRLDGTANRELLVALASVLPARVMPLLSSANDYGALQISRYFVCDGLTAPEIFRAAGRDELDLLYLIGEDLPPGIRDTGIFDTGFVVIQDMFLPAEAGEIADVVFPVASFTEVDGTYTNMEGRIQRVRAATRCALGSMSDCDILSRLARKLEIPGFEETTPHGIMTELANTVPFFKGIAYDALEQNGAFGRSAREALTESNERRWPMTHSTDRRGPRPEQPDKDYPFSLMVEFDEYTYRSTALSSQVRGLRRVERAGTVSLNSRDAASMRIENGMPVKITSRRGTAVAQATVTDGVQAGVARAVGRGGQGSPTTVLAPLFDPASGVPDAVCAVRIEKL